MPKIFFLFHVTLTLLFVLVSQTHANEKQNLIPIDVAELVSGQRILKIGHVKFPPFYIVENNELKGLDAEVIRAVAARCGFKPLKFIEYSNLPHLVSALNEGNIDLIANGIVETTQRAEKFSLTTPYYLRGGLGVLYFKGEKKFKTIADFKGYTLGVLTGSYPEHDWPIQEGIPLSSIQSYDTTIELIDALRQQEVDCVITNYTVCLYYQKNYVSDKFEATLIQEMPIVFMLRKQDAALKEKLNTVISEMWKDNTLFEIKKKYIEPLGLEPIKFH